MQEKTALIVPISKLITRIGKSLRGSKPIPKGMGVTKSFMKAIGTESKADAEKVLRGIRTETIRETAGPTSFILWPARWGTEKILGKKRVRKAGWKYISKPMLEADSAAGNLLVKIPGIGKPLFKVKEEIPWGKGLKKENILFLMRTKEIYPN